MAIDGRSIRVVDETLRDGHQCLWSTRMTNEMMLPIAARMDAIGYDAIDLIGGAVWDVAVRFLREDPWQRIRLVRSQIVRTPINAWIRGQSLWTFEIFPDDIVELAVERLAANGISRISLYDQMNDLQNVVRCVQKGREVGLTVCGALVFTWSPVHTDAYYVGKAREFVAMGADEIILKDPSGLLSVERVGTLVPQLKAAIGDRPLNVHSHCMSGRAPRVLIECARLGGDKLHTAIAPLAHGASHPPVHQVHADLTDAGFDTGLDMDAVAEAADYFEFITELWNKPRGEPVAFDPRLLEHQMPGGMITNLRSQLSELGLEHRLDEVLDETAQVRKDLGYAPMVSPTAQFMVTQAVLNVVQGDRYRTVPDELRKYVLGYYGQPPAPISPDLLDRVVTGKDGFVRGPAGSLVPPAIDRLRKTRGPFRTPEDLLHAAFYPDDILRPMFAVRDRTDYGPWMGQYRPMEQLLLHLARRRPQRVRVARGEAVQCEVRA